MPGNRYVYPRNGSAESESALNHLRDTFRRADAPLYSALVQVAEALDAKFAGNELGLDGHDALGFARIARAALDVHEEKNCVQADA